MGGMLVFGIVLAVAGLSLALFFDVAATLLLAAGIIVAIVGGATAVYGGALEKMWGLALLVLGLAVAAMGVFTIFLLDLWIVQWIVRYGGMMMVLSGVIMAGIGLIGMFKGDDDKHIEEMVEEELQSMKKSNTVRRNDHGGRRSHHGGDRVDRNVQGR
jgi:hypothetical protein